LTVRTSRALTSVIASLGLFAFSACDESDEAQHASPSGSASPTAGAPSPSPEPVADLQDGAAFAYASPDGTVWAVNADGSGKRPLLTETLVAYGDRAIWSPDGQGISYTVGSAMGYHGPAAGELRVLRLEAGQSFKVDDTVCCSFWSPRGRYLRYSRKFDSPTSTTFEEVLAEINAEGVGGRQVVNPSTVLSPDETMIAYIDTTRPSEGTSISMRGYPLYVSDLEGTNPRHLAERAGVHRWSPDGRYLSYWRDEHGGSATVGEICVIDLNSGKDTCLREFSGDEFPQWAPDLNRYVFHNYLIDPSTGTATELFEKPYAVVAWAPGGTRVAYTLHDSSLMRTNFTLVVRDLVEGNTRVLHLNEVGAHHSEKGGYYGEWSPNGRYFAFVAAESQTAASLYVLDSVTGQVQTALEGFTYRSVSISYSPDSNWLLIARGRWEEEQSVWMARGDGSDARKLVDGIPIGGGGWRPTAE
jgi:Tol biopolymer transport system component